MKYLLVLVPLALFGFSNLYKDKANKLRKTGKIPEIRASKTYAIVYLILGIATLVLFIAILIKYR